LSLCNILFPRFTTEDLTAALALVNRRNEELHSGGAAFEAYPPSRWLTGLYKACRSLTTGMGESLATLFGEDEAKVAEDIIAEDRTNTTQRVQSRIASHRSVFEAKSPAEQTKAKTVSEEEGKALAFEGHHRVTCPACGAVATVQGQAFGKEHRTDEDGEVVVRQAVSPASLSCSACGLKLDGYAELEAADLGGHYTRRTSYTPEEYYGLIHPDDLPEHIDEYLAGHMQEYDNE
jgi:transcription elongation factor Elf1